MYISKCFLAIYYERDKETQYGIRKTAAAAATQYGIRKTAAAAAKSLQSYLTLRLHGL